MIRKIDKTIKTDRAPGSGRPQFVPTLDNIEAVVELVCHQEGQKVQR